MADGFEVHRLRGAFNATFFTLLGPYLESRLRPHKQRVLAELPDRVIELGSGVGANLRWLRPGTTLVAVEPNPPMHARLRSAAARRGVTLELLARSADDTGLADASVDAVVSSLVLCTVADPAAVLAEVRRVLRPGGTYRFLEHVAAPPGSATRRLQHLVRRPWAWLFEGCSCERDLPAALREAGFASVELQAYRLRSPVLPFNPQVAGVAVA